MDTLLKYQYELFVVTTAINRATTTIIWPTIGPPFPPRLRIIEARAGAWGQPGAGEEDQCRPQPQLPPEVLLDYLAAQAAGGNNTITI